MECGIPRSSPPYPPTRVKKLEAGGFAFAHQIPDTSKIKPHPRSEYSWEGMSSHLTGIPLLRAAHLKYLEQPG